MTGLRRFGRLLRQDGGGGAGGAPQGDQGGGEPKAGADAPKDGDQGQSQPDPKTEARFSQADVDRIVGERLAKEKQRTEAAQTKAQEEAQAAALKEQDKFKELADLHLKRAETAEAKIADYDAVLARAERAETALELQVQALSKDLPAHLVEVLEGKDPVWKLEYLTKHREALQGAGAGVRAGTGTMPRPVTNGGGATDPVAGYLSARFPRPHTNSH